MSSMSYLALAAVQVALFVERSAGSSSLADTSPCTDPTFTQPEYNVSDFQFNRTTIPTGERALTHFQLQDVANGYSVSCTTPYLQDPNTPTWNDCEPAQDGVNPKTIFQYAAEENRIILSQQWICAQENGTFPRPYFSSATMELPPLECVDGTAIVCTLPDDEVSSFPGEYVTPIWKSDEVDIIPAGPIVSNASDNVPSNAHPCIGPSFSYPNWDLSGFAYDGTTVDFHLDNHASNQSTTCTFEGSDRYSCDNATDVQFIPETGELIINQTWACNASDRWSNFPEPCVRSAPISDLPTDNRSVIFVAVGRTTVNCEQDTCNPADTVIRGSLIEPIELTPDVSPEGVDYPGCLNSSNEPSWEVTSFLWNEIFRGTRNIGNVTVVMRNLANGFDLTCEAQGEELNADGSDNHERWWGCALEDTPFDSYRVGTNIQWNPVTHRFATKQTWYCDGHDQELPAKIIGNGTVDLPLTCAWSNSTYENVQVCSTEEPQMMSGIVDSKTELASNVFDEVLPDGYSCTIASVVAPKWRTAWSSDTVYADPTSPDDLLVTRILFNLRNQAFDGFQGVDYTGASVTPFLDASEPGRWYDCRDYDGGDSSSSPIWARHTMECKWQLDLATGYFALKHIWYCDDKDPEHPIVFTGTTSRYYDFDCYLNTGANSVACSPDNPPPLLPSTFSWDTSPEPCPVAGKCQS